MMEKKNHVIEEIRKKKKIAAKRRKQFLTSAGRNRKRRKSLNFMAGVFALISSGTILAILTDMAGENVAKVAAALIAFASGATSLTTLHFCPEENSIKMNEGANEFLKLMHNSEILLDNAKLSEEELLDGLKRLREMYRDMDMKYSAFYPKERS